MNTTVLVIFIVTWVGIGLVIGLWMARRGHDSLWTLIAVALGPLFVPIAFALVEKNPRLARSGPAGAPFPRADAADGPRILIGMDGSLDAARTLDATLRLFGTRCAMILLAEVVSFDATVDDTKTEVNAASDRLTAAAAAVEGVPVFTEVLAGPPSQTLRRFAEEQEMDLLVVGRRGRGLSKRLLGSVSSDLVAHSTVPVLVVGSVLPHQVASAG